MFIESLKSILLRKINNLLNPDFDKLIAKLIITAGISLITLGATGSYYAEVTFKFKWINAVITFGDSHNLSMIVFGIILILLALIFRSKKTNQNSENKTKDKIKIILKNFCDDINNNNFSEQQKKNIAINIIRELNNFFENKIITSPTDYKKLSAKELYIFIEKEVHKRIDG